MASDEQNNSRCKQKIADKNNFEGKFNTLRIISLKAISEFESLQKKCEENYAKYLEERENFIRTKKELDILKEVSGEALAEYENLHRKYKIEQDCKDKAEEFAKQAVQENKQLKRQSTILISTLASKVVDIDFGEIANEAEQLITATTEDHGLCNKQIDGLKEQVESLKIMTDDLTQKLSDTEETLEIEENMHKKTNEELKHYHANFKQLNQVSHLALEDYSNLQRKYEMEILCRAQAEKFAAEENNNSKSNQTTDDSATMTRDNEAMLKQSEFVNKDVEGQERLKAALNEISTLTKQLYDRKIEFDKKEKELEEELASSNDVHKLKSLENKINMFASGMETLETRLCEAQKRASDAETKAKVLEEQLKIARETTDVPVTPPLPPPPPPPPPPAQLLKKFVGMIGGSGKKKSQKKAKAEDPRIRAMTDMMDRIKTGKIELRKTGVHQPKSPGSDDGSAMNDLKDVLKTLKRSPSKENTKLMSAGEFDEQRMNFGVQLRKTEERKPRSVSNVEDTSSQLKSLSLRKPRSHSTGDDLDDEEPAMDKDLQKLLKKHKAAAEREEAESQLNGQEEEKEKQEEQNEEEKNE